MYTMCARAPSHQNCSLALVLLRLTKSQKAHETRAAGTACDTCGSCTLLLQLLSLRAAAAAPSGAVLQARWQRASCRVSVVTQQVHPQQIHARHTAGAFATNRPPPLPLPLPLLRATRPNCCRRIMAQRVSRLRRDSKERRSSAQRPGVAPLPPPLPPLATAAAAPCAPQLLPCPVAAAVAGAASLPLPPPLQRGSGFTLALFRSCCGPLLPQWQHRCSGAVAASQRSVLRVISLQRKGTGCCIARVAALARCQSPLHGVAASHPNV
eukprot:TRINITY_DN4541_c0_g2_i3.p1 TRINITY_DN4541_c0_g2~~TRINITY_DN4541_c0_g2_i3.p1  ORF type:complete len:267 (-),score=66.83 TRINITY_DN4541_c0_g2_i3:299-1099(-)